MNVVSFCVYGKNPIYRYGALKNLKLCKEYYPGWEAWFYLAPSIEKDIAKQLKDNGGTAYYIEDEDSAFFTNYRYLACADQRTERVIFRDTDSRIGDREVAAVNEWIAAGTGLHVMRDHPWHAPVPNQAMMLAGMWGVRAEKLRDIKKLIFQYPKRDDWGIDQMIITQQVYPRFLPNDITVHDDFYDKKPFPTKRKDYEFVGCQYDENDKLMWPKHIDVLKDGIAALDAVTNK